MALRRRSVRCPDRVNYFLLLCIVGLSACTGNTGDQDAESKKKATTTITVSHDTIPETRKTVSRKPVASYYAVVGDPKLDRKFGISVYETAATFQYLLRMQYEAIEESDTLTIPNFGIWPVVQVHPGHDKLSCIIGFLDQKKDFKEYKMLTAKGDKLKLVVLKRYSIGNYRTVY